VFVADVQETGSDEEGGRVGQDEGQVWTEYSGDDGGRKKVTVSLAFLQTRHCSRLCLHFTVFTRHRDVISGKSGVFRSVRESFLQHTIIFLSVNKQVTVYKYTTFQQLSERVLK